MTALNFDDCIGCGLCVLGCPAFEETGFDVLTARGRNKALQAGLAAAEMVEPIWACTLCGYCDAICPSDVHNVAIVLHLRRELAGGISTSAVRENATPRPRPTPVSPALRLRYEPRFEPSCAFDVCRLGPGAVRTRRARRPGGGRAPARPLARRSDRHVLAGRLPRVQGLLGP